MNNEFKGVILLVLLLFTVAGCASNQNQEELTEAVESIDDNVQKDNPKDEVPQVENQILESENEVVKNDEFEPNNDILADGTYRIAISNLDTDSNGSYIDLQTEAHYYLIHEYILKCEEGTGLGVWDDPVKFGEYYFNNNYPIEVIENGKKTLIGVQDLKTRTTLTGNDFYEQLFSFNMESGGAEILDVFNKNTVELQKLYFSDNCTFEFCYISNFGEKQLNNFSDNINAVKEAINNSYNGMLESMEIEVNNNKIIKMVEIYMP